MKEIHRKSAAPIYGVALCWVLWGLVFPLYRWWHFVLLIALSVVAYFVLSVVFPGTTEMVEEKIDTGNDILDSILKDKRKYLASYAELKGKITNESVAGNIERMENALEKICDHVAEHPDKAKSIRKFMNYYLPTSEKLLRSYVEAGEQGVQGENISSTMSSVEGVLSTVADAFEKQLDNLFENEALDISTDIVVLENMLKSEGLTNDNNGGENNGQF